MDTGTERLIAKIEGGIGWIIFNNPARHNAVSLAMAEALGRVVDAFAADVAVRAIIVTGAGERAFVSGADISEFAEKRAIAAAIAHYDGTAEETSHRLEVVGKPSIAMIRGYCIGGGLDLALRCDLRIAAEDARFAVPAAKLGLGYSFTEVRRLAALVGPSFAKEIFFTGRQFNAIEALRIGLVNRVVAVAELESTVRDYAATIIGNAPLTIAAAKRCVAEALIDPEDRDLQACHAMVDACFASADYVEGRTAFHAKATARIPGSLKIGVRGSPRRFRVVAIPPRVFAAR